MFLGLAKKVTEEETMVRWEELLKEEAKIIQSLVPRGDRMH
jgi:hypothetical protein